jgi:hypothetical protein
VTEPKTKGETIMDAIDEGRVEETTKKPRDLAALPQAPGAIEALAAIEHQRWADWQSYFMGKLERLEDGRLVISTEYEDALRTLIETPYPDLSEEMKAADRREVGRYWSVIEQFVADIA